MAEIIAFPASRVSPPPVPARFEPRAEILFFTGVRYSREVETIEPEAQAGARVLRASAAPN